MTRKKLARGYTTGTCAQAATKAAAWMLLTGEKVRETEVILPNGETARFPIEGIKIEEGAVSCGVKKRQRRRSGYHQWDSGRKLGGADPGERLSGGRGNRCGPG